MKGSKKLNELLEDNQKKLKKLFKYDHKKALAFTPEDRGKVKDKFGVYVIFDEKKTSVCRSNWRIFIHTSTYK